MDNEQACISHKNLQKSTLSAEKTMLSQPFWHAAETKIWAGPSQVTGPAELIEMVQYAEFTWPCKVSLDEVSSVDYTNKNHNLTWKSRRYMSAEFQTSIQSVCHQKLIFNAISFYKGSGSFRDLLSLGWSVVLQNYMVK